MTLLLFDWAGRDVPDRVPLTNIPDLDAL